MRSSAHSSLSPSPAKSKRETSKEHVKHLFRRYVVLLILLVLLALCRIRHSMMRCRHKQMSKEQRERERAEGAEMMAYRRPSARRSGARFGSGLRPSRYTDRASSDPTNTQTRCRSLHAITTHHIHPSDHIHHDTTSHQVNQSTFIPIPPPSLQNVQMKASLASGARFLSGWNLSASCNRA